MRLDLTDSLGKPEKNTNGVYGISVQSYARQVRSLRSIRKDVEHVVIAYDPAGAFDGLNENLVKEADLLARECRKQGLRVYKHHLALGNTITQNIADLPPQTQAILTLRDSTAYKQMEELIIFCNTQRITLLTSELASVYRGAALGFGNAPGMYVPHMISLLLQVKADGKSGLEQVKMRILQEKERMTHNKASLPNQGVVLSEEQEDLLDMVSVYTVS